MRLVALLALVSLCALARPAAAQAPGATVSGTVHDSVAGTPLVGAVVQIAGADAAARHSATAYSDSLGRFALAGVPAGRYMLGFFHPALDSLGVEAPMREVVVAGREPVRADLAIPSPARLRAAICGAHAARDSAGGVVVGFVRDARDRMPIEGARVAGAWVEYSLTREGLSRRTPRLDATTGANGWFAMCGVPTDGTMGLVATRGADSTAVVDVQVPASGFLRRELYVGGAGGGRLHGTAVAAVGGRPLADATARIVGGPETRTNARGEWALADAPVGTRMLEVRAVGYYPVHRPVDVVQDAAPVEIALSTLAAVLDTVRVTARYDQARSGFEQRRRSGAGRYLTAADVARRAAYVASDLFTNMAGVTIERGVDDQGGRLRMRGAFGSCEPGLFIDGHHFAQLSLGELDAWVRPDRIAALEIYTQASVPGDFRKPPGRADGDDDPCGSIVIWTK